MSVLEKLRKLHAENGYNETKLSPSASMTKQEALAALGHDSFRRGQEEIIDDVMASGDIGTLAICPTGWGKSLIYQVAGLMSEGITLVVGPLISLMKDQVDALKQAGIQADMINSTLTPKQAQAVLDGVVAGDVKLLFVSPERFRNENFQRVLAGLTIGLFAVDESHCISKWGNDFRPAYTALGGAIRKLRPKRVVALTATATEKIQDDICEQLGMRGNRFVRGVYRPNLKLAMFFGFGSKRHAAIAAVVDEYASQDVSTGIIYAATRRETQGICNYLNGRGFEATYYHAGLKNKERTAIQNEWAQNGGTIVATCAFGMGIDRPDVRFVLHSGLAPSVEDWYQQAGRAGRDGEEALCASFWDQGDYQTQMNLIAKTLPEADEVIRFWDWLNNAAQAKAEPGEETAIVEMTQKQMAQKSRCFNASACVSFLRKRGLVTTLGRGKYSVAVGEGQHFDVEKIKKARVDKIRTLDKVVRFYRHKGCRYEFVCEYFGDESFEGPCGLCDNCQGGV